MTICAPNSGKWSALVEGLTHTDKKGGIFETFKKIESGIGMYGMATIGKDLFQNQVLRRTKWQDSIKWQSFPNLALDHFLPNILNLLDIEKEVFYLTHFACFLDKENCKNTIIFPLSQQAMESILRKTSRQQTAVELKQTICQKVDCDNALPLNSKTWMNCFDDETNDDKLIDYQRWCKKCKSLP